MQEKKPVVQRLYLYDYGDEFSSVTGGWRNYGYNNRATSGYGVYATKEATYLALGRNTSNTANFAVTFSTTNAIDLSPYSKIVIEYELYKSVSSSVGNAWIYLPTTIANASTQADAFGSDYSDSSKRKFVSSVTTKPKETLSINLGASDQTAYIAINLDMWSSPKQTYIRVYSVYLEK